MTLKKWITTYEKIEEWPNNWKGLSFLSVFNFSMMCRFDDYFGVAMMLILGGLFLLNSFWEWEQNQMEKFIRNKIAEHAQALFRELPSVEESVFFMAGNEIYLKNSQRMVQHRRKASLN